mmetsp:Transcript_21502/g.54160  ORF Transcript_21502/g.54160 Transcript_21502/m.54160 type:complete len:313 (+) Transcript_21502:268-1206(+)
MRTTTTTSSRTGRASAGALWRPRETPPGGAPGPSWRSYPAGGAPSSGAATPRWRRAGGTLSPRPALLRPPSLPAAGGARRPCAQRRRRLLPRPAHQECASRAGCGDRRGGRPQRQHRPRRPDQSVSGAQVPFQLQAPARGAGHPAPRLADLARGCPAPGAGRHPAPEGDVPRGLGGLSARWLWRPADPCGWLAGQHPPAAGRHRPHQDGLRDAPIRQTALPEALPVRGDLRLQRVPGLLLEQRPHHGLCGGGDARRYQPGDPDPPSGTARGQGGRGCLGCLFKGAHVRVPWRLRRYAADHELSQRLPGRRRP